MKTYKMHLLNEKADKAKSADFKAENFEAALAKSYKILDQISSERYPDFRLVGLYEILYDVDKYNTTTK